jgi:hypothetical protein
MCVKSPAVYALLIANCLLGYYVLAIILAVITALITIFHHQIVVKLTPPAHWVKRSVLSCILSVRLFIVD